MKVAKGEDPTMQPRRVRFTIRGLMIAVLVAAILLSLPLAVLVFLVLYTTILAIMILVPAGVAPPGCRIEAAYWAMALHSLVFLVWLSALRFPGHCPPLYPNVRDPLLATPYFLALLSRYYLPIFGVLGKTVSAARFPRRAVTKPLLVLPIVWFTTVIVLEWDPFELRDWFWD